MGTSPIRTVLRSKGFIWLSSNHASAFYWSHAGQVFDVRDEGDWCAFSFPPILWISSYFQSWTHIVEIQALMDS